jgi:hypothetical protein
LTVSVVVAGALANKPLNGGDAWVRLTWVTGLARLGCRVTWVERIDPHRCIDLEGGPVPWDKSLNLSFWRQVLERFSLYDSAALLVGEECLGLSRRELETRLSGGILVNISGHLSDPDLLERAFTRVYIDIDPGFTQFWHVQGFDQGLDCHDVHFTIGTNIGSADCPIPEAGVSWRRIRQPVVLAQWPVVRSDTLGCFSTVGSWRGPYGPVVVGNRRYGLKVHEFRKFIDLPQRVPFAFELALDIHRNEVTDLRRLTDNGWRLVSPREVAAKPDSFRRYVQSSGAEFSIAQGIYVDTNSGWFSDRTTRYLASGKPALVQNTGFDTRLLGGDGLVAFSTPEEAATGAEDIAARYDAHAQAARSLAETYFDSDRVLTSFLKDVT